MRCQLMGAAFSAAMLFTACGGSDPAANSGTETSATQTGQAGQSSGTSAPAGGAAGSKAAPTTGGAAGGGAKAPGMTAAPTPSGMSAAAGTGGSPASSGMSAAAGSSMAAAGTTATTGAAAGTGAGAAGSAGAAGAMMTDDCDRKCLLDIMQQYLDGLAAHDVSKLKVSASVKVTDNGMTSKLGDGLFKTGTMVLNDHRLDFADPMVGNVATQVVVNEGMTGVIYQARLKVVKHEITEVETMTVRRADAANGFFNIDNMKPEMVFLQDVPAEKRLSRDKLEEITLLYLDYLEGKKRGPDVPFDMGCKRYENGQVTASGLSSFNAQSWSFMVTRRILVIDEEAQITWGMFPFTQAADTLVVGEAFKMIEGKIMMIQAVMAYQPAKVWD